ncbi:MAG TPA: S-layer homology domain-containing protein, partial [Syntrophomonadaceae bacterium]|nr:S-layer homology domain-containing protein [Syntrophomonadaceae bacterium]
GQAPTTIADNDGKITGTTVEMEYKLISEDSWTQATAGETIGLKAGTYQIRYKAKPGYNSGAIATVEVAEYIKSAEVGVVSVKVKGNPATEESANNYEIELPAGTILSELAAANIELILQDARATQTLATTSDAGATWVIEVTAEDGIKATYTIKVSVANAEQNAPEGLIGIAPTSASNADGKIKNTTDKMEYRLKGASSFIGIDGTEVTGLTPGTYEVRLLAREEYNAGAVAEVIVGEYRKDSSSDNSSGGSPSNNIDTSSKDTTRVETKKESNTPTKVIASTSAKVTKGTAIVQVSKNTVKDAIEKAQAAAKKNATEEEGISVEIKVNTKNITATNISVDLTNKTVDELAKAGVKEFTVNSDLATINLDLETLKTIQNEIATDVNLSAKIVDNNTLLAEAKEVVGNRPVFDFSITGTNGEKVTNFGKGKVSIAIPYTLAADEKAENLTVYYIDDKGKIQEIPNSVYDAKSKTLSFVTDHFSKFAIGYKEDKVADKETIIFTDITNHWAKDDIEFVTARKLFSGTGDNKFSPDMSMTRGMFVTVLGRLAEADTSNYKDSSFKDVKSDAYYMPYTEWARKNNIVNGVSATDFAPEQSITREQMAVIMENYSKSAGFELPEVKVETIFADSEKTSNYAKASVKQMQMSGIISGKDNNKFDPQGTATRAEVSVVLKRFISIVGK